MTVASVQLKNRLQRFLSELALLEDRDERMQFLLECAERLEPLPERIAVRPFDSSHLVPGCESQAYVWCENLPNQGFKFYFAIENPHGISARALAYILSDTLCGASLEEILQVSGEIVPEIFGQGISMGKGQGLRELLGRLQQLARQAAAKQ